MGLANQKLCYIQIISTGIFIMFSSNAFNFDQSKILSFSEELCIYPNMKAFADDKIDVSEILKFVLKIRKHCGNRRKCWLPTFFFLFPRMFSKGFLLKVVTKCVVKS